VIGLLAIKNPSFHGSRRLKKIQNALLQSARAGVKPFTLA
jgi:hypothetical protein